MSTEFLSNERRAVAFGSSQLGPKNSSISGGCEHSGGGGGQAMGRRVVGELDKRGSKSAGWRRVDGG